MKWEDSFHLITFCSAHSHLSSPEDTPDEVLIWKVLIKIQLRRSFGRNILVNFSIINTHSVKSSRELDLAFNNVKPKDWNFVLDLVRFRKGLGYERCDQHQKYVFFVRPGQAARAENPLGVSQGREQRGKDWDPEDPGAGRGGQCHHQSCELRVSLQGY